MNGDAIRQKREQLGMSQLDVARALKTTQQTIQRIEANKSPHSAFIKPLLDYLEVENRSASVTGSEFRDTVRKAGIKDDQRFYYPIDWGHIGDLIKFRRAENNKKDAAQILIPVIGMGSDPAYGSFITNSPLEYIERSEPLFYAAGAYALKIANDDMYPALKTSEIALVNPNLSPLEDEPHIFLKEGDESARVIAIIGYLKSFSAETWSIRQFSPEKTFDLQRIDFRVCHRIVGKFSRR